MRPAALLCATLAAAIMGCGTLGGPADPDAELPNSGISPFFKAAEPLAGEVGVDYRWPSVFAGPEGPHLICATFDAGLGVAAGLRHWRLGSGKDIWDKDAWSALTPPLEPTFPWEGAWLTAPFAFADPEQMPAQYWLVYAAEDESSLGLARSSDGLQWQRVANERLPLGNARPGAFRSPSLARLPGGALVLAWLGEGGRLYTSTSHDGKSWQAPVSSDFADLPASDSPLWERDGIRSARLTIELTPLGRPQWRLWYTGGRIAASGGDDVGVGFAGSWDGQQWQRASLNPILRAGSYGEKESAPYFDIQGHRWLVYAEFWKKAGPNRHVIRWARHGSVAPIE